MCLPRCTAPERSFPTGHQRQSPSNRNLSFLRYDCILLQWPNRCPCLRIISPLGKFSVRVFKAYSAITHEAQGDTTVLRQHAKLLELSRLFLDSFKTTYFEIILEISDAAILRQSGPINHVRELIVSRHEISYRIHLDCFQSSKVEKFCSLLETCSRFEATHSTTGRANLPFLSHYRRGHLNERIITLIRRSTL
jgi:hypothetical protein